MLGKRQQTLLSFTPFSEDALFTDVSEGRKRDNPSAPEGEEK